jgi:transcriptional repressor NrdR
MVMAGLPDLNEVAYVRFASVYRNFKDITGFEKELSKIRESKQEAGNETSVKKAVKKR